MFNSENFKEINYLNFEADFNIDLSNKIKIILGPNGTGKTSIYKNIKSRHQDYSFIDYNEVEQSVISRKDEIVIGASIVLLENKQLEKNKIIEEIDIKGNLKEFNITNKRNSDAISNNMDYLRKNPEIAIEKYSDENLDCIFDMDGNYREFFNKNAKQFIETEKIKTEINDIKDNYMKHFLEEIDRYLEDDDCICPVCGKENNEPIKVIIAKKMSEIKDIEEVIIKNYQETHIEAKPQEILESINDIRAIITDNNITINNLENYLICCGNKEKSNLIVESQDKLKELNLEIKELEKQKDDFYLNLKRHKESLLSTFRLQFSVNDQNILFDDDNKLIKIKLPRKVEEYSTGEINLMTFIICILEFISSDKAYLIIDDPLSSYDIPNQYKIMYEITSAKSETKNILIFTHNVDTINIANTQYNTIFEYEIIEKRKNTLYLNKIDSCTSTNVLSPEELLKQLDKKYIHKDYLNLLINKETWKEDSDNHLVFHYDEPFQKNIDGINYTNDYIANLIDNFDEATFHNISYLENTANKIIYTAALRIWIEKQFYLISNNDDGLHRKQFGPKIRYMFTGSRWKGPAKVSKEYLMSKKVMLNQHIHQQSQRIPFYYALNLTLDDISKEIKDIKEHFER